MLSEKSLKITTLGLILATVLVECDNNASKFKSPCGTKEEVAKQVSNCAEPMINILSGKFTIPKAFAEDSDTVAICDKFAVAEKCLRTVGKNCLNGFHKAVVGSIPPAIRKHRAEECATPAQRSELIPATDCILMKSKATIEIFNKGAAMTQAVRDMPGVTPEAKLIKVCCLINHLDKEIEKNFVAACPKDAPVITKIFRGLIQDARATICRNPKCEGVIESVKDHKYQPPQIFIEPMMSIIFDLNFD